MGRELFKKKPKREDGPVQPCLFCGSRLFDARTHRCRGCYPEDAGRPYLTLCEPSPGEFALRDTMQADRLVAYELSRERHDWGEDDTPTHKITFHKDGTRERQSVRGRDSAGDIEGGSG